MSHKKSEDDGARRESSRPRPASVVFARSGSWGSAARHRQGRTVATTSGGGGPAVDHQETKVLEQRLSPDTGKVTNHRTGSNDLRVGTLQLETVRPGPHHVFLCSF